MSFWIKFQRTFIFDNIINAFEQVGIYYRTNEQTVDRKSFMAIDTTKISEKNHEEMGNVLTKLSNKIKNERKYLSLELNKDYCLLI